MCDVKFATCGRNIVFVLLCLNVLSLYRRYRYFWLIKLIKDVYTLFKVLTVYNSNVLTFAVRAGTVITQPAGKWPGSIIRLTRRKAGAGGGVAECSDMDYGVNNHGHSWPNATCIDSTHSSNNRTPFTTSITRTDSDLPERRRSPFPSPLWGHSHRRRTACLVAAIYARFPPFRCRSAVAVSLFP